MAKEGNVSLVRIQFTGGNRGVVLADPFMVVFDMGVVMTEMNTSRMLYIGVHIIRHTGRMYIGMHEIREINRVRELDLMVEFLGSAMIGKFKTKKMQRKMAPQPPKLDLLLRHTMVTLVAPRVDNFTLRQMRKQRRNIKR